MAIALLPGTFDPVTFGHLDIIERASEVFDGLIVAVGNNVVKRPWFSVQERVHFLEAAVASFSAKPERIKVVSFEGLVTECVKKEGAKVIVKGVRGGEDYAHEAVQATTNRELAGVDTLFLLASPQWSHVSSSLVKELASWGADVSRYVPTGVEDALVVSAGTPVSDINPLRPHKDGRHA